VSAWRPAPTRALRPVVALARELALYAPGVARVVFAGPHARVVVRRPHDGRWTVEHGGGEGVWREV
jgi:hypothetical protein